MADYSRKKMSLLTMAMLCAWPFVSFLNSNQDDALLYGASISLYGLIFLISAGIGLGLICSLFGKVYVVAAAHTIGIACVCFFLYLPLSTLLANLGISLGTLRIIIWLGLSVCVVGCAWLVSSYNATVLTLFAVSSVMLLGPVLGLVQFAYTGLVSRDTAEVLLRNENTLTARPNVYWFVFDAYPRADVLRDYFVFDNDHFLNSLGIRDFKVSEKSAANFASTKLSISTTVSMEYYLPEKAPLHPAMWTARLQGFNPVVDQFQNLGYRYVHIEPGGNNLKTRCGGRENQCIRAKPVGKVGINEAEVNLLRLTPLFPIIRRLAPDFLSFDFISVEEVMAALDYRNNHPQFVFAHVMSPHPPQRFDGACGPNVPVSFELDGHDYTDVIKSYLNDLRCLNPLIIQLVDDILANDPSDPYIIIQSDHGFRGHALEANVNNPHVAPHLVAFANFSAMKLPSRCSSRVRERFSLVNTFRIVLACLEGRQPTLLPDRHFTTTQGILEEVDFEEF